MVGWLVGWYFFVCPFPSPATKNLRKTRGSVRIELKEAYVLDGRCAVLKAKSQVPWCHSDGRKEWYKSLYKGIGTFLGDWMSWFFLLFFVFNKERYLEKKQIKDTDPPQTKVWIFFFSG